MIIRLLSTCALSVSALVMMSAVTNAQTTPTTPNTQPTTTTETQPATTTETQPATTTETQPATTTETQPTTTPNSQQATTQKICSYNTVEGLLPPPSSSQGNSPLSYLAEQGFVQKADGSWLCYASDPQKPGRYYTLFKVQQVNGALVATSFLDRGSLLQGQRDRSVDLFMTLIQNHTRANPDNQQSIQRYLTSFVSLVEEGKIQPSRRGYLFDQPSRGLVLYHPVTGGDLQGTGITININSPQNLASSPASLKFGR
ncbi:hypothetical protein [Scytonema sp. NUACC21]